MTPRRQNRILIWKDYRQWRSIVFQLLSDLLDAKVLEELRQNPPRYFVSDNLSWFDDVIRKVKGVSQPEVCATLVERLGNYYQFIRAFHGCRSESVEPYKTNGLIPCNPANLDALALQIFQQQSRVRAAIKEFSEKDRTSSYREYNQGKVFFCLEAEELTHHCGHYLLYGSEYLLGIASAIGEREVLRRRGRAMIIECNVPFADLPKEYATCLAGEILEMIAEKYCVRPYQPQIIGFGFHINTALHPQHIVNFHFPTRIPNPHLHGILED